MQAFKNESNSIAPAHLIQLGTMEYSTLTPRGSELAAMSLNLQNWNLKPRIVGAAKMNDMSAVIDRSRRRHGRCRNTRRHRHIASQHLHDRRVQRIIGSAGSRHRNGMTAKSHFKGRGHNLHAAHLELQDLPFSIVFAHRPDRNVERYPLSRTELLRVFVDIKRFELCRALGVEFTH